MLKFGQINIEEFQEIQEVSFWPWTREISGNKSETSAAVDQVTPRTTVGNKKLVIRTPTNVESANKRADHVEMATASYTSAEFKMPRNSEIPLVTPSMRPR